MTTETDTPTPTRTYRFEPPAFMAADAFDVDSDADVLVLNALPGDGAFVFPDEVQRPLLQDYPELHVGAYDARYHGVSAAFVKAVRADGRLWLDWTVEKTDGAYRVTLSWPYESLAPAETDSGADT